MMKTGTIHSINYNFITIDKIINKIKYKYETTINYINFFFNSIQFLQNDLETNIKNNTSTKNTFAINACSSILMKNYTC